MAYKVHLLDALSPIEWSQARWRLEGEAVPTDDCAHERIHDVLLRHLPRRGLIVDAGCGPAKWPIHLRRLGYEVVGVDVSLDACRLARTNDGAVAVAVADARRLPFRNGAADAVLSLGVVEHDERGPLAGLREARRILRPGGLLVLSVPYNNPFRRLLVNPLQTVVTWRWRRARWKLGFVEYRFSEREVRSYLAEAGFEVVASYPNDYDGPRTLGLWVDWHNLTFNPFFPPAREALFLLPGRLGRLAAAFVRRAPWLASGEVTAFARAS